jgi:nucleoside-triphosphatase THEP1
LIQILGLPGIGKSSLVRSAIKYIYERKVYLSGIVFVQIKGIREFDRLLREIVI